MSKDNYAHSISKMESSFQNCDCKENTFKCDSCGKNNLCNVCEHNTFYNCCKKNICINCDADYFHQSSACDASSDDESNDITFIVNGISLEDPVIQKESISDDESSDDETAHYYDDDDCNLHPGEPRGYCKTCLAFYSCDPYDDDDDDNDVYDENE